MLSWSTSSFRPAGALEGHNTMIAIGFRMSNSIKYSSRDKPGNLESLQPKWWFSQQKQFSQHKFDRKCQFPTVYMSNWREAYSHVARKTQVLCISITNSRSAFYCGGFITIDVSGYRKCPPDSQILLDHSEFGSQYYPASFASFCWRWEAFPLRPNSMRPYPLSSLGDRKKKVFSTTARKVVEMAFAIMVQGMLYVRMFVKSIDSRVISSEVRPG